jgi:lipopolysaccharide export system protein LptC
MKTPLDAVFARPRPSPAHNENAATRRRYSLFVGVAKRLLPATALALLLLVAVWPRIQGSVEGIRLAGLPKVDISSAREVRMVEPRYTGLDRENRPFVVTADSAEQTPKSDDAISLDSPKADLTTLNGNWNELTAYVGLYQPDTQQLDLFGNVELYQDRGNALRSDSVTINMAQGTAVSHDPVEGDGTFGHVTGQGLRVLDRGETIIFTGHATLDLKPRQKPVAQ